MSGGLATVHPTGNGRPTAVGRSGQSGPAAGDTPCRVTDLTVRYGHHSALDGVTLDVPAGKVTAVIGGDGAGKTTLLRAVAGLIRPASGEIDRPGPRQIGFVSGTTGIYRDLTLAENLDFAARAYGAGPRASAEGRRDLLTRIGLADYQHRLAGDLSGGMRQKLAVALAMLHDPRLLLLDEATTGVDPVSRAELWRTLSGAAAAGAAVLLATTYLDEAERAGWVCLLDRGRLLLSGPPETVLDTVRGGIYTLPAAGGRPPSVATWRDGTTWRLWSPGGPPAGLPRAQPAEAELADAVIVASLNARDEGPNGEEPRRTPNGEEPRRTPNDVEAIEPSGGSTTSTHPPRAGADLVAGRDLVRRFGSFTAVDHVDITVSPGEVVGLLGANGAGKTTLIRMLLGLLLPSEGQVALLGSPPSRETRLRIGYVPQGLGLWDDLTVGENLLFATAAFGVRPPADLDPDLAAARRQLVRDLPLGLRRRLAFAAALAHHPRLLILDEPTSGVDPLARSRLWDTVRRAAADGVGVLVTTHYMMEATQCDRLILMTDGRVALAGTVADILRGRTAVEVETSHWAAAFSVLDAAGLPVALSGRSLRVATNDPAPIERQLSEAGIITRPRRVPASLEEVFVDITGSGGRCGDRLPTGPEAAP